MHRSSLWIKALVCLVVCVVVLNDALAPLALARSSDASTISREALAPSSIFEKDAQEPSHAERLDNARRIVVQSYEKILNGYDLRGRVTGEKADVTPDLAYGIGIAMARRLWKTAERMPRVLLTGDHRDSTPMLQEAAMQGLRRGGVDVVTSNEDVSTPAANIVARLPYLGDESFDGLIQITASHHPWFGTDPRNGFKISMPGEGGHLRGMFGENLLRMLEEGLAPVADILMEEEQWGEEDHEAVLPHYYVQFKDRFYRLRGRFAELDHFQRITREELSDVVLVVDSGNAVMGWIAKYLVRELGMTYVGVHDEVMRDTESHPAHRADPNLREVYEHHLPEEVRRVAALPENKGKIVLGIALDGDGDRLGMTDEGGGRYLNYPEMAYLFYTWAQEEDPDAPVAVDIRAPYEVVEMFEGNVDYFSPGWPLVRQFMRERGAVTAMEASNHVFRRMFEDPNADPMDDALFAGVYAAMQAIRLRRKGSSIHETLQRPWYVSFPKEVRPDVEEPEPGDRHRMMADIGADLEYALLSQFDEVAIETVIPEHEPHTRRLNMLKPDGSFLGWVGMRASKSDKKLSIFAQAESEGSLADIAQAVWRTLWSYPVDQDELAGTLGDLLPGRVPDAVVGLMDYKRSGMPTMLAERMESDNAVEAANALLELARLMGKEDLFLYLQYVDMDSLSQNVAEAQVERAGEILSEYHMFKRYLDRVEGLLLSERKTGRELALVDTAMHIVADPEYLGILKVLARQRIAHLSRENEREAMRLQGLLLPLLEEAWHSAMYGGRPELWAERSEETALVPAGDVLPARRGLRYWAGRFRRRFVRPTSEDPDLPMAVAIRKAAEGMIESGEMSMPFSPPEEFEKIAALFQENELRMHVMEKYQEQVSRQPAYIGSMVGIAAAVLLGYFGVVSLNTFLVLASVSALLGAVDLHRTRHSNLVGQWLEILRARRLRLVKMIARNVPAPETLAAAGLPADTQHRLGDLVMLDRSLQEFEGRYEKEIGEMRTGMAGAYGLLFGIIGFMVGTALTQNVLFGLGLALLGVSASFVLSYFMPEDKVRRSYIEAMRADLEGQFADIRRRLLPAIAPKKAALPAASVLEERLLAETIAASSMLAPPSRQDEMQWALALHRLGEMFQTIGPQYDADDDLEEMLVDRLEQINEEVSGQADMPLEPDGLFVLDHAVYVAADGRFTRLYQRGWQPFDLLRWRQPPSEEDATEVVTGGISESLYRRMERLRWLGSRVVSDDADKAMEAFLEIVDDFDAAADTRLFLLLNRWDLSRLRKALGSKGSSRVWAILSHYNGWRRTMARFEEAISLEGQIDDVQLRSQIANIGASGFGTEETRLLWFVQRVQDMRWQGEETTARWAARLPGSEPDNVVVGPWGREAPTEGRKTLVLPTTDAVADKVKQIELTMSRLHSLASHELARVAEDIEWVIAKQSVRFRKAWLESRMHRGAATRAWLYTAAAPAFFLAVPWIPTPLTLLIIPAMIAAGLVFPWTLLEAVGETFAFSVRRREMAMLRENLDSILRYRAQIMPLLQGSLDPAKPATEQLPGMLLEALDAYAKGTLPILMPWEAWEAGSPKERAVLRGGQGAEKDLLDTYKTLTDQLRAMESGMHAARALMRESVRLVGLHVRVWVFWGAVAALTAAFGNAVPHVLVVAGALILFVRPNLLLEIPVLIAGFLLSFIKVPLVLAKTGLTGLQFLQATVRAAGIRGVRRSMQPLIHPAYVVDADKEVLAARGVPRSILQELDWRGLLPAGKLLVMGAAVDRTTLRARDVPDYVEGVWAKQVKFFQERGMDWLSAMTMKERTHYLLELYSKAWNHVKGRRYYENGIPKGSVRNRFEWPARLFIEREMRFALIVDALRERFRDDLVMIVEGGAIPGNEAYDLDIKASLGSDRDVQVVLKRPQMIRPVSLFLRELVDYAEGNDTVSGLMKTSFFLYHPQAYEKRLLDVHMESDTFSDLGSHLEQFAFSLVTRSHFMGDGATDLYDAAMAHVIEQGGTPRAALGYAILQQMQLQETSAAGTPHRLAKHALRAALAHLVFKTDGAVLTEMLEVATALREAGEVAGFTDVLMRVARSHYAGDSATRILLESAYQRKVGISSESPGEEEMRGFIERVVGDIAKAPGVAEQIDPEGMALTWALRPLFAEARREMFPKGTRFIRKGMESDAVYLIISGEVVVQVSDHPGDGIVRHLHAGSIVGEIGAFTGRRRFPDVVAQTQVLALTLQRGDFLRALDARPEAKEKLTALVVKRELHNLMRSIRDPNSEVSPVRLGATVQGSKELHRRLSRSMSADHPMVQRLGRAVRDASDLLDAARRGPIPEALMVPLRAHALFGFSMLAPPSVYGRGDEAEEKEGPGTRDAKFFSGELERLRISANREDADFLAGLEGTLTRWWARPVWGRNEAAAIAARVSPKHIFVLDQACFLLWRSDSGKETPLMWHSPRHKPFFMLARAAGRDKPHFTRIGRQRYDQMKKVASAAEIMTRYDKLTGTFAANKIWEMLQHLVRHLPKQELFLLLHRLNLGITASAVPLAHKGSDPNLLYAEYESARATMLGVADLLRHGDFFDHERAALILNELIFSNKELYGPLIPLWAGQLLYDIEAGRLGRWTPQAGARIALRLPQVVEHARLMGTMGAPESKALARVAGMPSPVSPAHIWHALHPETMTPKDIAAAREQVYRVWEDYDFDDVVAPLSSIPTPALALRFIGNEHDIQILMAYIGYAEKVRTPWSTASMGLKMYWNTGRPERLGLFFLAVSWPGLFLAGIGGSAGALAAAALIMGLFYHKGREDASDARMMLRMNIFKRNAMLRMLEQRLLPGLPAEAQGMPVELARLLLARHAKGAGEIPEELGVHVAAVRAASQRLASMESGRMRVRLRGFLSRLPMDAGGIAAFIIFLAVMGAVDPWLIVPVLLSVFALILVKLRGPSSRIREMKGSWLEGVRAAQERELRESLEAIAAKLLPHIPMEEQGVPPDIIEEFAKMGVKPDVKGLLPPAEPKALLLEEGVLKGKVLNAAL